MNSKGRRFLLYILLAAMVVTQVAFVKTEENNTSDESVVYNTNSTDETENATDAEKDVLATNTEVPSIIETEIETTGDVVSDVQVQVNENASVSRMVVVAEQTNVTADETEENADPSANESESNEVYLGVEANTEVSEYQDMIVSYADPYLPVRTEATRESTTVGKLFPGSYADIVERGDEWTKIKSGNVEGYIQNIYVCFDEEAEDLAEQLGGTLSTAMTLAEEKKAAEEAAKKAAANKNNGTTASMSASSYEICLLAAIIDWEANAESYDGKVAVGRVVLNRVASSRFGNSVQEVLSARGQFGGVTDGNGNWSSRFQERINKYVNGANNDCLKAAQDALAGANPLNATYYYFNTIVGSCSQSQQIGHHIFYNY